MVWGDMCGVLSGCVETFKVVHADVRTPLTLVSILRGGCGWLRPIMDA